MFRSITKKFGKILYDFSKYLHNLNDDVIVKPRWDFTLRNVWKDEYRFLCVVSVYSNMKLSLYSTQ